MSSNESVPYGALFFLLSYRYLFIHYVVQISVYLFIVQVSVYRLCRVDICLSTFCILVVMSEERLAGKVAIVTGSSSGIGQAIAVRLAKDGADVVINYRKDEDGANETKRQIDSFGRKSVIVRADVSKLDEIATLTETAWKQFGKADVLVNNAGVEKGADFVDVTEADYDMVLEVNL